MTSSLAYSPLSVALKERTASSHEQAENSDFMSHFLSGNLPQKAVIDYTAQLFYLYSSLEAMIRQLSDSKPVSVLMDPRLERRAHLMQDLSTLAGENFQDAYTALPATASYTNYLEHLAHSGERLRAIAHHYVRYLGDLSGGQVIARRLRTLYGLSPQATSFYDFSQLGKIKPYRDGYRARLDSLELSPEDIAVLTQEATRAFEFNHAIFAELGAVYLPAAQASGTDKEGEN